jgi:hypothetical protein
MNAAARPRIGPRLGLAVIAVGALFLLAEMAWSVWKFHAFTPMFWVLAWMAIAVYSVLRAQTRLPRPHALRQTFVWYAVATAISVAGWWASPALNAWLQRQ